MSVFFCHDIRNEVGLSRASSDGQPPLAVIPRDSTGMAIGGFTKDVSNSTPQVPE